MKHSRVHKPNYSQSLDYAGSFDWGKDITWAIMTLSMHWQQMSFINRKFTAHYDG